jgi:hypothetical protein
MPFKLGLNFGCHFYHYVQFVTFFRNVDLLNAPLVDILSEGMIRIVIGIIDY